jgi:lipopolysaccharide transport system ATP-binding protein
MHVEPAITVERISKRFTIGRVRNEHPTLREAIAAGAARLTSAVLHGGRDKRVTGTRRDTIWALDDVSFHVGAGEVVGLIGANGAGKSTLLKVLARITEPTTGHVRMRGRVGSLLEVGTGFHLELTGRENIFLNGAILGMRRREIQARFDEIVAFSEIERFIDTAVKFYSSGMYLRLAFAVAAHLEPEILFVDEVLAVGDASFQQKCLAKMDEVARQGRTVLFVSHNLIALESLCERVLWMRDGRLAADGPAQRVIGDYLKTLSTAVTERVWSDFATAAGNEYVCMQAARVRPLQPTLRDIDVKTPFVLEFEYWQQQPGARLLPSIRLFNDQGVVVFNVGPLDPSMWNRREAGQTLIRDVCHVPGDLLNDGVYRVSFSLCRGHEVVYCLDNAVIFDVRDTTEGRDAWYGKWAGAIRPALEWHTELIEAPMAAPGARPDEP